MELPLPPLWVYVAVTPKASVSKYPARSLQEDDPSCNQHACPLGESVRKKRENTKFDTRAGGVAQVSAARLLGNARRMDSLTGSCRMSGVSVGKLLNSQLNSGVTLFFVAQSRSSPRRWDLFRRQFGRGYHATRYLLGPLFGPKPQYIVYNSAVLTRAMSGTKYQNPKSLLTYLLTGGRRRHFLGHREDCVLGAGQADPTSAQARDANQVRPILTSVVSRRPAPPAATRPSFLSSRRALRALELPRRGLASALRLGGMLNVLSHVKRAIFIGAKR